MAKAENKVKETKKTEPVKAVKEIKKTAPKKVVVLLSGKMRSGKDQFADYLITSLSGLGKTFTRDFFAKSLKEGVMEDFKLLQKVVNEKIDWIIKTETSDSQPNLVEKLETLKWNDDNYYDVKTPISRALLQIYGTEIFRNRVKDTYWVDQVVDRIKKTESSFYIITDARFINEIDYVKEQCKDFNVISVRIDRDMDRGNASDVHPSEVALDDYKDWNEIVDNNGTLEDLNQKAVDLVAKYK